MDSVTDIFNEGTDAVPKDQAEKTAKGRTYNKAYYTKNADRLREYRREYYRAKAHVTCHNYYLKNKERILENLHEYYAKNQDKIKTKALEYYNNNKDKIREYSQAYYAENADRIKEVRRKYYDNNVEKLRERGRNYYYKNRDAVLEKNRGRNKDYYREHRSEYFDRQKKLRARYAEQNKMAQTMCPAFIFLSRVRAENFRLYLTRYKEHENLVNKTRKTCAALMAGDANQCPLMQGALQDAAVQAQCSMPRVFEFDTAVAQIQNIIAQLKQCEK